MTQLLRAIPQEGKRGVRVSLLCQLIQAGAATAEHVSRAACTKGPKCCCKGLLIPRRTLPAGGL